MPSFQKNLSSKKRSLDKKIFSIDNKNFFMPSFQKNLSRKKRSLDKKIFSIGNKNFSMPTFKKNLSSKKRPKRIFGCDIHVFELNYSKFDANQAKKYFR
jgi:hypothetical protein